MTRFYLYLLLCAMLVAAVSCGSGGIEQQPADDPGGTDQAPEAVQGLPGLSGLPYPAQGRSAAAAGYELLDNAPVLQSAAGVSYSAGEVVLDAAGAGGFAWAVFALPGFPTDGSVYPVSYSAGADAPVWTGYSNYNLGHWQFTHVEGTGGCTYGDGTDMLSPAGVHYVAVFAVDAEVVTVNSLQVEVNTELPAAPVAVLNVLSQVVAGLNADFCALGSSFGAGAPESITYDWGDGEPPDVTTDPAQEVQHTYADPGTYTVELTVRNSLGQSAVDSRETEVGEPLRELLLVYNAAIPEDADLAAYYASPRTGRAVDPDYILGITPTAEADPEVITWDNYLTTIRDAITGYLDAHTAIRNGIKYILLCKGIPHKIYGENEFHNGRVNSEDPNSPLITLSTYSSVDSDLCLLYNEYDRCGWMYNGADYFDLSASGFYLKGITKFSRNTFKVTWVDYSDTVAPYTINQYTLNYLVGRLSAYSYDNVKQMINRAINADTTGSGSIIFDSCQSRKSLDTMVDPVWPSSSDSAYKCGYELLYDAKFAAFQDVSALVLTGLPSDNITVPVDAVIGYSGWGVNHSDGSYPNGGNYILKDLLFTYLPGACFISYESFNGRTFATANIDDPSHSGQAIIADFLYRGGTVAIGNANEPFTIGVGDERWVFNRYIIEGDRWIEAAYKGLRLLSWQEVVVGDPLCRVNE